MTNDSTEAGVSDRRRVLQAAGLVGAAVLLSRVVGLGREIVVRSSLGVLSPAATAYEIATRFPEAIFLIIAGGAIGSAFIPTFAAYFESDDEAGGWRLFSAVINLVTVTVIVVAAASMLLAPQLVRFFARQQIADNPQLLPLTVSLMRVMLLSPIIFGASGVIMGALNARQHFLLPALAPTVYNIGIIAGGLMWPASASAGVEMGFAAGTVAGAAGHFLIQLPGLRQKHARYTAVLNLRDPGVRQVLRLMAPRVLGLSFSEINKFVVVLLTDPMAIGSLPALNTAFRLIIMPQGIIGQALGIAAFPTLAAMAARAAHNEMRRIITDSLRILLFLSLPMSVLLIMLRRPLVAMLFERGMFTAEGTDFVAWALLFYALGLVSLIALEVISRAFYALSDTLTPVLAGGVQIVFMWILSLWLSQTVFPGLGWLPLGGLALGFSLSNMAEAGVLLWLLRRRLGGLHGTVLLNGFWRMGVASLVMAGAIWLAEAALPSRPLLVNVVAAALAGGAAYILACLALRLEELHRFLAYGRQRLGRR